LFNGSKWTGEDVLLVLEMFKVIGHMGDGLENVMLGFLSSILPSGNTLSEKLGENKKTTYFYQQAIKSGHGSYSKLAIIEIQSCRKWMLCVYWRQLRIFILFSLRRAK
jgi:hypothetical protein